MANYIEKMDQQSSGKTAQENFFCMEKTLNLSEEDFALLITGRLIISEVGDRYYYSDDGVLHREGGPAYVSTTDGTNEWFQFGKLHREDGPAVIDQDGHLEYYQHGQLHCNNGPAVVCADGDRWWYQHGNLHREDGPAIVRLNGLSEFWINGKRVDPF